MDYRVPARLVEQGQDLKKAPAGPQALQAQAKPGKVVRTRVAAADGSAEFTVALEDRMDVVESIIVVTRRGKRKKEKVEFVLQGRLPPSGKR